MFTIIDQPIDPNGYFFILNASLMRQSFIRMATMSRYRMTKYGNEDWKFIELFSFFFKNKNKHSNYFMFVFYLNNAK